MCLLSSLLSGKIPLLATLAAGLACLSPAHAADSTAAPLVHQAADPFALPAQKDGAAKHTAAALLPAAPAAAYPLERKLTDKTTLTFKDDKCGQPDGRKGDFLSASLRTHF